LGTIARAGLNVLAAASEPVTGSEIAARAGWATPDMLDAFYRAARPLLVERVSALGEPTYKLFHPAFAQFISETLLLESAASGVRSSGGLVPANFMRTIPVRAPVSARYLLGVGVDDYVEPQLRDLGFCGNDVLALASLLGSSGYTVTTLHDRHEKRAHQPTLLNVRAALSALKDRFRPEDLLWVHFSCHGMLSSGGRAYLLASDSRYVDPITTALPIDAVVRAVRSSGSRRWLLTLDACHAGIATGRDAGEPQRLDRAFVRNVYELAEGGAILAACTAGQRALDSPEVRRGVFTHAMLEGLAGAADRTRKGFITLDDLKVDVIDRVRSWSFRHLGIGEPQTPSFKIEGTGDLILIDNRPTWWGSDTPLTAA
jgi:hypothetical protein